MHEPSSKLTSVERTSSSPRESARVRVIYVAGVSHTGSTLLGHILGELEETCYAGEIRNTWQRGILENRICTCDARFAECAFWQTVIEHLPFAAERQAEKLSALHREAVRPSLVFPFRSTEMKQVDRSAFAAPTEALYAAAGDVAGVRQLVDSSKSPLYAAFLRRLPTIDLRVVHIVRDPRATVYSHLRRHSFGYGETFKLSLWWLRSNVAIEKLGRTGVPYTRIRYEDFVEDPARDEVGQRDFRGRDEPPSIGGLVAVLGHLRQLPGAVHRLLAHQHRRPDLGQAVLLHMCVDHELRERPVHPDHRSLHHHEARA